ncbi:related to tripeptidyl-peptidase I [Rhynchosporium graminicola]|uniref:tripeptidyl-peptidase II n=1 Tax=Rhynchosporium graminicola TaxID=2792576 RepID=A0A1E1JRC3_9HELO|nr:related to tripeptidyl-peptidase I [Rhynchosporium commune]
MACHDEMTVLNGLETDVNLAVLKMKACNFLVFASYALSSPLQSKNNTHVRKDIHPIPTGWRKIGPADYRSTIQLDIALISQDAPQLERHISEVSNPHHQRYGQHLSADELRSFMSPAADVIRHVEEWLQENGVSEFRYNSARDWIKTAPVSLDKVERLLNTKYSVYHHQENNITTVRTNEWSLPSYLHDYILTVQPTNSFLLLKPPKAIPRQYTRSEAPIAVRKSESTRDDHNLGGVVPSYDELAAGDLEELGHVSIPVWKDLSANPTLKEACNQDAISALCISFLYGTANYHLQSPDKIKIGLVNYLGEDTNETDINTYLESYVGDAASDGAAYKIQTHIVNEQENEANFPSDPHQTVSGVGLEAALDAETLIGLTHPIPITAYNVGGRPPFLPTIGYEENINEPYLAWINYMLSLPQEDLPHVVTSSYGEPEQTVPLAYAQKVCQGFAQLGARGVSIIFASGDDGIGKDGNCFSNDGENRSTFLPVFPASCPFVTSVGGTRGLEPEIAAFNARTGYVTGGGFSNYFPRPRWQDVAVTDYLRYRLEPQKYEGLFNSGGRGIPDVAATSYHYAIIHKGQSHLSDGTSAASPTFASIIALLDDALLAEGRPPLGFLNPWIYSEGFRGFTDIIYGSNSGCNTTGFPALEGWDPVTGFGTPNFPQLKDLALQYRYRSTRPWYYG